MAIIFLSWCGELEHNKGWNTRSLLKTTCIMCAILFSPHKWANMWVSGSYFQTFPEAHVGIPTWKILGFYFFPFYSEWRKMNHSQSNLLYSLERHNAIRAANPSQLILLIHSRNRCQNAHPFLHFIMGSVLQTLHHVTSSANSRRKNSHNASFNHYKCTTWSDEPRLSDIFNNNYSTRGIV